MGSQNNTIVINGKRYDAKTGRLLTTDKLQDVTTSPRTNTTQHKAKATQSATNARTSKDTAQHKQKTQQSPAPKAHKAMEVKSVPHRSTPKSTPTAHNVHHKHQRSQTLMRTAVKKPAPIKVDKTKVAPTPTTQPAKPIAATPKYKPVDAQRANRAQAVQKSTFISKFGADMKSSPVRRQVSAAPTPAQSSKPTHHETHQANPQVTHRPYNPFQSAIQDSESHQEKLAPKPSLLERIANKLRVSPRTVSVSSFVVAGFLLTGFFAYQNMPNLAMRMASARSGVEANLPAYQPTGFVLDESIHYTPGQLTMKFHSNTDERQYTITQKISEWNNDTLLEKFVTVDRRPYQTYQENGRTIYIYDGSNATWLDNGIWYQIEGNSSLSSDQLLRLASSM